MPGTSSRQTFLQMVHWQIMSIWQSILNLCRRNPPSDFDKAMQDLKKVHSKKSKADRVDVDWEKRFEGVLQTAVRLAPGGEGRTTFFPAPELPPGMTWPTSGKHPLHCVLKLDLAEVAEVESLDWLPSEGDLLFFYNAEDRKGVWDSSNPKDIQVIYMPPGTATVPVPVRYKNKFKTKQASLASIRTYPATDHPDFPGIDKPEWDSYDDWTEQTDQAGHRVGGYAFPIQEDMTEGAEELYHQAYAAPDAVRLEEEKAGRRWKLLLQLDSDDSLNSLWGDAGMLYYWIREEDARAHDFSKVVMIMQCC